jgi:hypothetical protein
MMQTELDSILSDAAENPPTRVQLFAQRRQLESELQAAQAKGEKELGPLEKSLTDAEAKYRLAMIARNNVSLRITDCQNGLRNSIGNLNIQLRTSAPASIERLLSVIHEKRIRFQEFPHMRNRRSERR